MVDSTLETRKIWLMVASDSAAAFRWEPILENHDSTFWWVRRLPRNFRAAWDGDFILCYRSGNEKRGLVGLAEVEEGFNGDGIAVRGLRLFEKMIPFHEFRDEPVYQTTEAGRLRNRGTLFSVHEEFAAWVKQRLKVYGDHESAAFFC